MKQKIIIYQVLPRIFGNTNNTRKPNGTIKENGVGKMVDFTPKVLREISQLGATHIWYTGLLEHATKSDYTQYGIPLDNKNVVKGNAGSPYAIKDYYDIDPDIAVNIPNRMLEFEELVKRTHHAGLDLIIDFVPNHVARNYYSDAKPRGVKDFGTTDNTEVHFSPQNNFYYIPRQPLSPKFTNTEEGIYSEYPAKATGNDCFGAHPGNNDWYETIKLNYGIDYQDGGSKHFEPLPDTWLKMRDILLFWADKKVDGFRCDMAEMVPVEFWGWVIPQIKKLYPRILFIAEIYNPHEYQYYLNRGKFDYLYDKVGLYDLLRSVVNGHAAAYRITNEWQSIDEIKNKMLNFLENHDEQRIASLYFANDPFKGIPALVVSATMNQNPFMIYSGQELGEDGMDEEGFSGRDGRTTIFDYWSEDSIQRWYDGGKCDEEKLLASEKELRNIYKRILNLCNTENAISNGNFFDLMYVNNNNPKFDKYCQYAYLRQYKNELLVIAVNFSNKAVDIAINIPEHAFDLYDLPADSYEATDLMNQKKEIKLLSHTSPFLTHIKPYYAVMWKIEIPVKNKTKQKINK